MRIRSIARLLFTALLVGLVTAAGTATAQTSVGDRKIDEGDFVGAIATYDQVLASDPDDARALYQRARAQVYLADDDLALDDAGREALYVAALADAERAVQLAPEDADAHFELARSLGRTAQFRGVLQSLNLAARMSDALDRTIELNPEHAGAWHARALWNVEVPWIAGGRAGLVVPSFERAIEIEPDEITHRVAFAAVLIDREEYARAAEQLDVAASLTPRSYLDEQDLEEAAELRDRLP